MKTELIIYDLDEMTELISAAKSYSENSRFNCNLTDDLALVDELIQQNRCAIFVFSIRTKDKFQSLINIFKKNIKDIKNGRIKIAYFQIKKNPKIENILRKFNCNDFLDSEILKKSLCYKIDIWEKSVQTNIKKDELLEVRLSSAPIAKKVLKDKSKRAFKIVSIESITEDFDIWISPSNNSKNVLSKWLVNLKGPSPHISSWESVEAGLWKFEIDTSVKDQFFEIKGNWYFKGLKPEFNWKEKFWSFSSNEFNLYFKDTNDVITSRAFCDGQDLSIRANSKSANLIADLIDKSADSKVSLDTKKVQTQEEKKSLKGSKNKQEFMEAESKTERLNSKLSGKSKGEDKKTGHFKGKFKESTLKESSNYSLKVDPVKDTNLSGKLKKSELKNKSDKEKLASSDEKVLNNPQLKKNLKDSDKTKKSQNEMKTEDQKEKNKLSLAKSISKSKKSPLLNENEGLTDRPKTEMEKAMVNPAANSVRLSTESVFYLCELVDLFEEELYITVKDNQIDRTRTYQIVLSIDIGSQKATITTEGKVDSLSDGIYKFNINKIPQTDYDRFMTHFEIKQDEINDFLIAARGF